MMELQRMWITCDDSDPGKRSLGCDAAASNNGPNRIGTGAIYEAYPNLSGGHYLIRALLPAGWRGSGNNWYDLLFKSRPSGTPLADWTDAGSVSSDIVLGQNESTFDADGKKGSVGGKSCAGP
jgi:hypothetical protein